MRKITTSQNHTQLKSVSYMTKKGIFVVPRMPRFFDGSNIFFVCSTTENIWKQSYIRNLVEKTHKITLKFLMVQLRFDYTHDLK